MGKKLLLFFIIIAFLVSCSNEINSQTVFFEWQGQGIWLETESLNMEKAIIQEKSQGRTGIYEQFYDEKTGKIYLVFTLRKEGVAFNSEGLIYQLDDNGKSIDKCYKYLFMRNNDEFGSYIRGIYDSVVLASSSSSQYELFHLDFGFIEFIDIEDNVNELYPICFKNNRLFFLNGFYDCNSKSFSFYPPEWNITENWKGRTVVKHTAYPNISADGTKVIARNDEGEITVFDLDSNKSFNTGIKRSCDTYLNYTGNLLYYLDNEHLYFSKDTFVSRHSLSRYFTKNKIYPSLAWYCYNIKTGEVSKIKSPKGVVYPIGQLDKND